MGEHVNLYAATRALRSIGKDRSEACQGDGVLKFHSSVGCRHALDLPQVSLGQDSVLLRYEIGTGWTAYTQAATRVNSGYTWIDVYQLIKTPTEELTFDDIGGEISLVSGAGQVRLGQSLERMPANG